MKRFNIIIAILAFIIASCGKDENSSMSIIDLSQTFKEKHHVALSYIADSIQYVKLETNRKCLIGRIQFPQHQLFISNDRIFISDGDRLFVFDINGNFQNTIGSFGKGPGEFAFLTSYTVLEGEEKVAVFSAPLQAVLLFDFQGNFLGDFKFKMAPSHVFSHSDTLVGRIQPGVRPINDFYSLARYDLKGHEIDKLVFNEFEQSIYPTPMSSSTIKMNLISLEDSLFYWEALYDTIWTVQNDTAFPKYHIKLGKDQMPFKYYIGGNRIPSDLSYTHIRLSSLIGSDRYFFFSSTNKGWLSRIVFDKTTGESYNLDGTNPVTKGNHFSFRNDLDGGYRFWPQGTTKTNQAFQLINVYTVKSDLQKYEMQGHYRGEFGKIVNESKPSDNPIVILVNLKK